jgi:DMSO/TMAO reductase YedYZ heme-binding membrane subunit
METIELSGVLGLIATVILTLNILMGIMLSTGYKQSKYWEKFPAFLKRYKIVDIHNYTAYVALSLVLIHAIIIPLDASSKFSYLHLLKPLQAPHQPFFVMLGLISLIALFIVIITTQKIIKKAIGQKTWRWIHVISYVTGIVFIIHGLVMDPLLKDRPIDFIDPEKLLVEACGIILLLAFAARYQYKKKQRAV